MHLHGKFKKKLVRMGLPVLVMSMLVSPLTANADEMVTIGDPLYYPEMELVSPVEAGDDIESIDTEESNINRVLPEAQEGIYASIKNYPISVEETASTTFEAANWKFYAQTAEIVSFFDYKNYYNVVYGITTNSGMTAYIHRYDDKMKETDVIKIDSLYPMMGDAICDNEGNYYIVWAQNDVEQADIVTLYIAKYSYDGTLVAQCEFAGSATYVSGLSNSGTQLPFSAGNCDVAISDGVLACNYARQMYNGHQSNYVVYVDCSTMKRVNYYANPYCSHSFDQRIISVSDGGFLAANHGDAYSRAFRISLMKPDTYLSYNVDSFHFREGANRDHGYNETYAQLGSIVETKNGYVFCGSSERTLSVEPAETDAYYCGKSEARDLFIQVLKKDYYDYKGSEMYLVDGATRVPVGEKTDNAKTELFLNGNEVDYGVIWLTEYDAEFYVNNPTIVAIEDNRLLVMWEKLSYQTHTGTSYYAIINEDGSLYRNPLEMKCQLAGNTEPVYKDGKVFWVTRESGEDNAYIHSLDVMGQAILVDELTLNMDNKSAVVGETIQLESTIKPSNASDKNVYYVSSDEKVAEVDAEGKVTAIAEGTAQITAYALGNKYVKDTMDISVFPLVSEIKLENIMIQMGEKNKLSPTVLPENVLTKELTYSSSNTDVVKVDDEGNIEGITEGIAIITATAKDGSGIQGSCAVQVVYTGLAQRDGKWIFLVNSVQDTKKNGLVLYDENWFYITDGELNTELVGFVKYDNSLFYVAEGRVCTEYSGLVQNGDVWYFIAEGQFQHQYSGLALYDGEWFLLNEGILDSRYSGIFEYEGSLFLVADGQILSKYSGLYQDGDIWYYIAEGRVVSYTGLVQYDNAWFYVIDGRLATEFSGYVNYDNSQFRVVNGQVVVE